jgi:hypothetical protein
MNTRSARPEHTKPDIGWDHVRHEIKLWDATDELARRAVALLGALHVVGYRVPIVLELTMGDLATALEAWSNAREPEELPPLSDVGGE